MIRKVKGKIKNLEETERASMLKKKEISQEADGGV